MIGNTLRLLRKIHGKTLKEMAYDLGVSPSYVSAIENEKRKPSLELLEKYAKIFDMSLNGLLFFYEEIKREESVGPLEKKSRPLFYSALKILEKIASKNDGDRN